MTDTENTETENTRTMLNQLSNEIIQLKSERILSDNQAFRKHILNQLSANTMALHDLRESIELLLEKVEVEDDDEDTEEEEEKPKKKVKKKGSSLKTESEDDNP